MNTIEAVTSLVTVLTHDDEHEALCRRCGASCHLSLDVGSRKYIIEEIHCRFLARQQNGHYACTVYENRFERAPWCHHASDALEKGALGADCPYASHIPGYQGKIWASAELREKLLPLVREKLLRDGLSLHANPNAALQLLAQDGRQWTYAEDIERFTFRTHPMAKADDRIVA